MEVIKGRMYDYNNGRFLSVDPFIQDPSSTQSMNPYTYILNNPLSGTDPSGYRFIKYVANAIRFGNRYVSKAYRRLKKSRSEERKPTIESPPDWGPNGDIPGPPPILPQPSNPTGPSKTTSPTVDNFGSKTESPIADQTSPNNTANDNGNQNSNQGTMMNENKGDTSDIGKQNDKPAFEIDKNGTPDSVRGDLETAGYPGKETTETKEGGTLHEGVKGTDGDMDVRVMDGQSGGKKFKGPRVKTTRAGTNDSVRSDGSKFRNNESKSQRQQESHVQLEKNKLQ